MGDRQMGTQPPCLATCPELDFRVSSLVLWILCLSVSFLCIHDPKTSIYSWEFSASENPFLRDAGHLPEAGWVGLGVS